MTERPHLCYERIVPAVFEAAGTKFWAPGTLLSVSFLDGHQKVKHKVQEYALEWTRYANITFDFVGIPDPLAHIRVSFEQEGSWSALGRDALNEAIFPVGQPTMNFGWLRPDSLDEDYSVVLHEFGHALGLVHEHQSPASGIHWDRAAVIHDLSGPPNWWDLSTIEHNVFQKYGGSVVTQFSEFDPKSIMLYTFPSYWTFDGMQLPENKQLSKTDKEFIRQQYPA